MVPHAITTHKKQPETTPASDTGPVRVSSIPSQNPLKAISNVPEGNCAEAEAVLGNTCSTPARAKVSSVIIFRLFIGSPLEVKLTYGTQLSRHLPHVHNAN